MAWHQFSKLDSRSYRCGYCGESISSQLGYSDESGNPTIYICHSCEQPTYFDLYGEQTPGSLYGDDVKNIDDELVSELFDEAKNCLKTNSFTASVLCCRKLLMHIAVSKGAKVGLKFIQYIDYLDKEGYIPVGSKGWVDYIREQGNIANHEIVIIKEEDAKKVIDFMVMLLKITYEFPEIAKEAKIENGESNKE